MTLDPAIESVLQGRSEQGVHLRKADWCVRDVEQVVAEDMVRRYHYAKGGANTATHRHGLFQKGDIWTCYGLAWWMPPTKGAAIASWDGDWQQVLCLSRLVILPGLPTNAASFLLAKSIHKIAAEGVWRCLITYADTWRGHTGTIYRATNWEYLGFTKPERVWLDVEGRMVSRKAGPRTRTRAEMIALGYRSPGSFPKHKFRLILPRRHIRPVAERKVGQMGLFETEGA